MHHHVVQVVHPRRHPPKVGQHQLRERVEQRGARHARRDERAVRGKVHPEDEALAEDCPRHHHVHHKQPDRARREAAVARQQCELQRERKGEPEATLDKVEEEGQVARVVEQAVRQRALHAARQPHDRLRTPAVQVAQRQLHRSPVVRLGGGKELPRVLGGVRVEQAHARLSTIRGEVREEKVAHAAEHGGAPCRRSRRESPYLTCFLSFC